MALLSKSLTLSPPKKQRKKETQTTPVSGVQKENNDRRMSFSFDQINHTHTSPCLVGQTWVFRADVRAKQCGRGVSRTCFFVTLPFFSMFLLFFLSFNYLKRRSWKRTHTHINTHTTQNNNNKKKRVKTTTLKRFLLATSHWDWLLKVTTLGESCEFFFFCCERATLLSIVLLH